MAATLVWLPVETEWIAARVLRCMASPGGGSNAICLREDSKQELSVPVAHLLPREVLRPRGVSDLTQLSHLHEPAILDVLGRRFSCGRARDNPVTPPPDAWALLQAKAAALEAEIEGTISNADGGGSCGGSTAKDQLQKHVYTYCGRICIAVNPYERLQVRVPSLNPIASPPLQRSCRLPR
eukprot:SAG11_NODE_3625_length_2328_cov_1.659489_4_plen_181_part_00